MGFVPIQLDEYVTRYLAANPGAKRGEVTVRLRAALEAFQRDERCHCGERIWVIGSAEAGFACFTCITREATPTEDYEIAEACEKHDA